MSDDDEDEDVYHGDPMPSSATPGTKRSNDSDSEETSPKKLKEEKQSHHKKISCQLPNCSFNGGDIKRHLLTHANKGDTDRHDIPRLAAIMKLGKILPGPTTKHKTTGKKKAGRRKKWCPLGCDAAYAYLGTHLQGKKHRISKDSSWYHSLLKRARPYDGIAEMGLYVHHIDPPADEKSEMEMFEEREESEKRREEKNEQSKCVSREKNKKGKEESESQKDNESEDDESDSEEEAGEQTEESGI